MSGASPARGQSILIQVHKLPDSGEEEESCRKVDAREVGSIDGKIYRPESNAWFIIRDTTTGLKISQFFRGLPQEKTIPSRYKTGCVSVGSDLYDIGGRGSSLATRSYISSQIRRLNTETLNSGWNCNELPFYCANPTTAVFGNFIYLFPNEAGFTTVDEQPEKPWAYMYDTIKQKAYELNLPDGCVDTDDVSFCASLECCGGVIVPIMNEEDDRHVLYLHKTNEMVWEKLESRNVPISRICSKPYAVSNGIMYVYSSDSGIAVLLAFEIKTWRFLRQMRLPKFINLDVEDDMFIVPAADNELCFVWHKRPLWYKDLYYAKVLVSLDPPVPSATLLKEAVFHNVDVLGVINCLQYASISDDEVEKEQEAEEVTEGEKPQDKLEEIDVLLEKEIEVMRELMDFHEELARNQLKLK